MASNIDENVVDTSLSDKIKNIILKKAKASAPKHIASHIRDEDTEVIKGDKGYTIKMRVLVTPYKGIEGIADARAQEYGSGIHNTRKFKSKRQKTPTSTYEITPKKPGGVLVFQWEATDINQARQRKFNRGLGTDKKIAYKNAEHELHQDYLKQLSALKSPMARTAFTSAWNKKRDSLLSVKKYQIDKKFKNIKMEKDDSEWVLKRVDHPGIHPYKNRGYMRYALEQSKSKILSALKEGATENLRLKIRTIFSRPGGVNK